MEIRVGFEITDAAARPTPTVIMLAIQPSRRGDLLGNGLLRFAQQ